MISHEQALDILRSNVPRMDAEEAPLEDCVGRILAADVATRVSSPPFDKAAMDGYAARAADLETLPATLRVVGDRWAGDPADAEIGPGQCARIATGAPVPRGADCVVMVEHTEELPDGRVRIDRTSGSNICPEGEDMEAGDVVLSAGERLTPARIGVAAAAGHDRLPVRRRPSIALLCTGSEVVEAGAAVAPGRIYNSNGPMLSALLRPEAESFTYLGIAPDTPDATAEAVRRGLEHDVLVVSGGVSVGRYDLVPDILTGAGVETLFHGVAVKPGKPAYFGRRDGGVVFGLPGNPVACLVGFHALLRPAFAAMADAAGPEPPFYRHGIVREGFANKPARKNFLPCRIEVEAGTVCLNRIASHGSADIVSASRADGFMAVPRGIDRVEAGDTLEYFHA